VDTLMLNNDSNLDLLNHPVISERYFFPRPGRPREFTDFQGVDGARLRCSQCRPHPLAKTLIHFHGNGEIVADYDDGYLENLAALGVNVLMVEYRGYGDSEGQCQLGKMLQDVDCVREQCGLAAEETVIYGRSVGAIFAVEWARREPDIAGLILESGVADPYQRLAIRLTPEELGVTEGQLKAACREYLDHRVKLESYHGPLLVLHAAQDTLVTPDHAQAHMDYCPSDDKRLVLFPRGGHNTILGANWRDYLTEMGAFIERL
jgi:pimeloyl-ACP methyl ester carboxylesterase